MKRALLMCILIVVARHACFAEDCHGAPLEGEPAINAILASHSPADQDQEAKKCITEAIEFSSEIRAQGAVPQLIRYLTFQKAPPPEMKQGLIFHPPIEGDDYPAVLALARIGDPARLPLVQMIHSESASDLERQNAAHAIVLSFLLEPEHDPGKGILYLQHAEVVAEGGSKRRFDQAIEYALTTPACLRFEPKCTQVVRHDKAQP